MSWYGNPGCKPSKAALEEHLMPDVEECIARRLTGDKELSQATYSRTIQLWRRFRDHGLAKGNFVDGICSQNVVVFCQHFWEMLLANHLIDRGLAPHRPSTFAGPDFRIQLAGRVIWIEATAPGPGSGADRVPDRLVDPIPFIKKQRELYPDYKPEAHSVPTDLLILRWTQAIRDKWRRWTVYLAEGIVNEADSYVIAVNGCNLGFAGLHTTEDYEIALRAVFPFGKVQATWNLKTDEITHVSREYAPFILKANHATVPTNIFLDNMYSSISAIIATNTSPLRIPLGRPHFEFGVIHNPLAENRLDVGALNADVEFVPHPEGDGYRLAKVTPHQSVRLGPVDPS
jgi:type I restriction enzyme S subunit